MPYGPILRSCMALELDRTARFLSLNAVGWIVRDARYTHEAPWWLQASPFRPEWLGLGPRLTMGALLEESVRIS